MQSVIVIVLCLRVIDCDVIDWLDLPELTSIQVGDLAFTYDMDDASSTLIMQSDCVNVNWRTRLAQTHNTHSTYNRRHYPIHIRVSSSHHSREWFSSVMKWCLDMPSLTNVDLPKNAFDNYFTLHCSGWCCVNEVMNRYWSVGWSSQTSETQPKCE